MAVTREIKYALLNSFLTAAIYWLLVLYTRTLRVRFEGVEKIKAHLGKSGRIIISSWHQRFFGGFFLPRILGRSPCIMISQSRDGDFISRVVRHIGWIPVRGSRSRGGKAALRAMVQGVIENHIGGHIVDGPTGPPGVVKPGLISLAWNAGAGICPGVVSYENAWTMNSWDRFMVPKPFSRVLFRFGRLFPPPEGMSDDRFESFRKEVEDVMTGEYKAADDHWKG